MYVYGPQWSSRFIFYAYEYTHEYSFILMNTHMNKIEWSVQFVCSLMLAHFILNSLVNTSEYTHEYTQTINDYNLFINYTFADQHSLKLKHTHECTCEYTREYTHMLVLAV